MTKICNTCNVPMEETTENFRTTTNSQTGKVYLRGTCRKCEYAIHTEWGRKNVTKVMIQSAKFRAKRDKVPFTITVKDVVIPDVCPIFGVKLEQGTRQEHENSPSLDRIIPEKGYVVGNIRVISHLANMLKSKATLEQLERLVDYLSMPYDIQSSFVA